MSESGALNALRTLQSSRQSQFFVIFLTILLSTVGFGVCIPVLPIYADRYGATGWQNGLLTGVFSLCQFLVAPYFGKLSDRFGRRPILIVSVIGSAIGYFILGWSEALGPMLAEVWNGGPVSTDPVAMKAAVGGATLAVLFAGRTIDGISGGNVAAAQAYIADITTPAERSRSMGMIGAAFGLGFILGPALGGVLSKVSAGAPFIASGLLCLLNVALIVWKLPESLPPEKRGVHHQIPLRRLWQHANAPLLKTVLVVYFLVTASFSIMTQVYALMNERRFGLDTQHTGYILALIGAIGVLIQGGLLRRILARTGEVPLAMAGVALLVVSFFLLPLSWGVASLIVFSSFISVGNSFCQPTLNGLASRSAEADWQGRALGVLQSAGSLGRFLGPFIGGSLLTFDLAKPLSQYARTPLWAAAGMMLVSLLLSLRLRRAARSVEAPVAAAL
ncbi:MAG: MFS transporter [Verrucomicrobiales bacterium]